MNDTARVIRLSPRQRYGLDQAARYGNFGAVPTVTARSLVAHRLAVLRSPHHPRGHVQLTPAGWALLTADQRQSALAHARTTAEMPLFANLAKRGIKRSGST